MLTENEILIARTQGVGVLPAQLAINASITGPMLRASGVNYDIRKVDKYGIYERFNFRVPLGDHGDVYDRYMIRVLEMRESLKILNQALRDIPAGPIMDPEGEDARFSARRAGEAYGRIEGPKGELGFYLDQRRLAESLSLSRASAEPDQSDRAGRHVPRPDGGGRGHHSGQRGYRAGRSGSIRDCF